MRFACDYAKLTSVLSDVYGVAEDPMTNDKLRNIIFQFGKDGKAIIMAFNSNVIIKKPLQEGEYELSLADNDILVEDKFYMNLSSKELREYLNSYKNVRTTTVDKVIFENADRSRIKCTTIELVNLSEEDKVMYTNSGKDFPTYVSHWMFNNTTIPGNQFMYINQNANGVETTTLNAVDILFCTKNLLPLLQNGTDMFSSISFDETYAVATCSTFTTVMKNEIKEGGVFSGISLVYKCIDMLTKLATVAVNTSTTLEVAKLQNYIYIKTADSEVFLLYGTKLIPYNAIVDSYRKDNVITLGRIYLKDVLKRLSLVNDNIEVSIKPDDNIVTLSNSKFTQDININLQRNMAELGKIRFKLMPDVFTKSIIGSDEEFTMNGAEGYTDVYVYCCKSGDNISIYFADGTGMWFSNLRTKTY